MSVHVLLLRAWVFVEGRFIAFKRKKLSTGLYLMVRTIAASIEYCDGVGGGVMLGQGVGLSLGIILCLPTGSYSELGRSTSVITTPQVSMRSACLSLLKRHPRIGQVVNGWVLDT